MTLGKIAFLDCETTGLNPDLHDVWEIGLILRYSDEADAEFRWTVKPDLTHADPKALEVGCYYDRTVGVMWDYAPEVALNLARFLAGAVVVGSNPAFDQAFLTRWLQRHGQVWTAHYRTVDVTTLGWGYLIGSDSSHDHGALVPRSEVASRLIGVDPDDYERHSALGDARWVRDQFSAITAPRVGGAS